MLWTLIDSMHSMGVKQLTALLAAVAAVATVLTLAMPLLAPDVLNKRMKSVALEREKIRQRERERLARGEKEKVSLRQSPKQYMQRIVERFNLTKWLAQEAAREKLVQAGYRGQAPYVAFLFFRLITPVVMFAGRAVLPVRGRGTRPAADGQDRDLPRRRLCRHAGALFLPQEPHLQAPALDQARISGRARPAADLRRIRHVDRGGVQRRSARKSARSRSRWRKS